MSEERLNDIEMTAEGAVDIAKRALARMHELEDRIDELEDEVADLRAENEQLRDRTDLLANVRKAANRKPEERAVVLIQTLYNEAWRNKERGNPPLAQMDKDAAMKALGGSVQRQLVYPTFEKAADLVGDDDLLWYQTEPRSSSKNNRLKLDLDGGEMPSMVAGHEIEAPTVTATGGAD